jgi:EAL domain-containing protein (putative c-di-GMP-specific phosphodiesterase class I)
MIVDMATVLDLKIIVKDIELKEEDRILKEFDNITVQGYLIPKTMGRGSVFRSLLKICISFPIRYSSGSL